MNSKNLIPCATLILSTFINVQVEVIISVANTDQWLKSVDKLR